MDRPKRLSKSFLKKLTQPGRYGNGHGGFSISALAKNLSSGKLSITFSQRYTFKGKKRTMGLGKYPVVSLEEAEQMAIKNLRKIRKGKDPNPPPVVVAPTKLILEAFEEFISEKAEDEELSPKTVENYGRYIRYITDHTGNIPLDQLTSDQIIEALRPVWKTYNYSANRALAVTNELYDWCVEEKKYLKKKPFKEKRIRKRLKPVKTPMNRRRAVPFTKMPGVLQDIVALDGIAPQRKYALIFLMFTVGRSKEVREVEIDQIDLDNLIWTVPEPQMKMQLPHRVPLTEQILPYLQEASQFMKEGSPYLFPGPEERTLTKEAIWAPFKAVSGGGTPHGCRRSFTNFLVSVGVPKDVPDACLAHVTQGVQAHYLTADMFVRRRKAMQVWGAFLCGVLDPNWKWTEPTVAEIIRQKELDVELGFDYDELLSA